MGNYGGHLDCQVFRAPQYLNPALVAHNIHSKIKQTAGLLFISHQ